MKKSWYSIQAKGADQATIDIFDDIGTWGVTAKDFIGELKALGEVKTIDLRINSYGGEVFDGLAIYNALKFHPAAVNVTVYGIAASIASLIAMAGDKVMMPENAFMFVHNPIGGAIGDAEDMREVADALDKIKSSMVRSYVAKTLLPEITIEAIMAGDTWLSAEEAKELGFADEILEAVKLAARADLKRYNNLPEPLAKAIEPEPAPEPDPKPDPEPTPDPKPEPAIALAAAHEVNELCKAAAAPELAGDFLAAGKTPEQVRERLKDAGAIRAACAAAKLPERAQRYLKAGFTLAEVRADLFEVLQARDIDIDNKLPIEERRLADLAAVIDLDDIYAARRRRPLQAQK